AHLRCVCTRDEVPTRQLPVNVPSFRSISSAAAILSSALDLPRHRSLIRRQGSSPRGAGRSIRCPAALAFSLLAIPKKVEEDSTSSKKSSWQIFVHFSWVCHGHEVLLFLVLVVVNIQGTVQYHLPVVALYMFYLKSCLFKFICSHLQDFLHIWCLECQHCPLQ
ncbi:unnamed protein product, partial [Musa banksii]